MLGEIRSNSEFIRKIPYAYGIFGGAVRSSFFHKKPRDIDIAVNCSKDELREYIGSRQYEENSFGGFKLKDGIYEIDIWPLEETWSLKHEGVEPTFRNLARYASFNVDCVVLVVPRVSTYWHIVSEGFYEAIDYGFVEVNYSENPVAPYNAVRGLRICRQYNLKPGASLIEYVKRHITDKNRKILEMRYERIFKEPIAELWKLIE